MKKTYVYTAIVFIILTGMFLYGYFKEYKPFTQIHQPLSFTEMIDYMAHSCFTNAAKALKNQDLFINQYSSISTTSPQFVYVDPLTSPEGLFMTSPCGKYYIQITDYLY